MATRIQVRRDSSASWVANNPILQIGEIGFDTTANRFKIGIASNETSRWNVLPYLNVIPSELAELAQDAVDLAITAGTGITKTYNDNANTITLAVNDTIPNKTYVDTAVSGLGNTVSTSYIPLSMLGNPDGVATLDEDGYVTDSEISSNIARSSEVSLKANAANTVLTGNATAENLEISGSLTFSGVATTIDSTNLSVTDSIIYLADSQFNTDALDIGIYGAYGDVNTGHWHTGLIRDHSDGKWKLFSNGLEPENNLVDLTGAVYDTIKVGKVETSNLEATGSVTLPSKTISSEEIDWNVYSNVASLPSATTNKGMVAYVEATNLLYLAYSDQWFALAPMSYINNIDNTSDLNKPVSTATQTELNKKVDNLYIYVPVAGTSATLSAAAHKYNLINFNSANSTIVTIPNDTQDAGWEIGSWVEIRQNGDGQVEVQKDAAVTLQSPDNQYKTRVKWSSILLEKVAANTWLMTGDTTA
jgi:hypothetical protein